MKIIRVATQTARFLLGHGALAEFDCMNGASFDGTGYHDHPNLFLAGGGLFPTVGTANPTLTIVALALRTADLIAGELGVMIEATPSSSPVASPVS